MRRARDRGHYRPRQPEGDRALHQSGGSTETGGFGNGENEYIQWPTLRKVSQKTQKAVRDQGGFMWRTNRSGLDDGGELGRAMAPTSSPSDTRRAVTMPSKGAFTSV